MTEQGTLEERGMTALQARQEATIERNLETEMDPVKLAMWKRMRAKLEAQRREGRRYA